MRNSKRDKKWRGFARRWAVAWLLCLLGADKGVWAQSNRATVRVDGRSLFQVGGDNRDKARARADQIETRLNRLLETPSAIAPVQTEKRATIEC